MLHLAGKPNVPDFLHVVEDDPAGSPGDRGAPVSTPLELRYQQISNSEKVRIFTQYTDPGRD